MADHPPALKRLGLNRWLVTWPGCSAFECDDAALAASLRQLSQSERDGLYARALAESRKRAREEARLRWQDRGAAMPP
jgi:hypothetical protein